MAVPPLSDSAPTQGVSTTAGQDLCFMPATALAAAIRAKKVSPAELVNAVYARIHQINPGINAFCTLTEEQAHRAAVMIVPNLPEKLFPRVDLRRTFDSLRRTAVNDAHHVPLAP